MEAIGRPNQEWTPLLADSLELEGACRRRREMVLICGRQRLRGTAGPPGD
jgi:hypothetical protein